MIERSVSSRPVHVGRLIAILVIAGVVAAGGAACRTSGGRGPAPERGIASWYGGKFHGRITANGERYDMHQLTAAHKTLPFGTVVEVVNLDNGRRVVVRINDRGPFIRGRIIDLSYAAAQAVGMVGPGVARVEIRPVIPESAPRDRTASDVRYTVQVAAFREVSRAADLQVELGGLFPDTVVRSDGAWHRVQVGAFDRRRKAEAARRELARRGYSALVVPILPDTL